MSPSRKDKLLEQKARIEARLKAMHARDMKRRRKEDTRRKIIAGALALAHAEVDPEFGAILAKLLNRYVAKAHDRALFDLPERQAHNPANDFAPAARPRAEAESA